MASSAATTSSAAHEIAGRVRDPELPMLTLADLGVLREVRQDGNHVTVTITPTYSGCPAMATMRDDLIRGLTEAGYEAEVVISLSPPWSSDDITEHGRAALRAHGMSVPAPAAKADGPVPLTLFPTRRAIDCPRCGSSQTERISEFGPTACKALYRCTACLEPFEHIKEL